MSSDVMLFSNSVIDSAVSPWKLDDFVALWGPRPPFTVIKSEDEEIPFDYHNAHTGAYFWGQIWPVRWVIRGIPQEYLWEYQAHTCSGEFDDDIWQLVGPLTVRDEDSIDAVMFTINFARPYHYYWEWTHVMARICIELGGFMLPEGEDAAFSAMGVSYPPFLGEDIRRNPLLQKYEDLWFRFFPGEIRESLLEGEHPDLISGPFEFAEDVPQIVRPRKGEGVEHLARRILSRVFSNKLWPESIGSFPLADQLSSYKSYYLWWRYMWQYPESAQAFAPPTVHTAPVVPIWPPEEGEEFEEGEMDEWRLRSERFIYGGSRAYEDAFWGALCETEDEWVFIPSWVEYVALSDPYTVRETEDDEPYTEFHLQSYWLPIKEFLNLVGAGARKEEHGWVCKTSAAHRAFEQADAMFVLLPIPPGEVFIEDE